MAHLLRLVENVVLGLCGLVMGWVAVRFLPEFLDSSLLRAAAVTLVLALGGRLLFNGTIWTAGLGLVISGVAGGGLFVADVVSSLGA